MQHAVLSNMISVGRNAWNRLRFRYLKMVCTAPQHPIIFIIGSTGTGKSDLAVHLASRFNGEIINADAMQIYRGLPIVTNKLSAAERGDMPHHLFDFVDPLDFEYRVSDFRRDGTDIIRQIRSRNKLPIVAGGSMYYVESLLWEILVSLPGESAATGKAPPPVLMPLSESNQSATLALSWESLQGIASGEMHKMLSQVDPEQAKVLHPNDKRKIIRSLEIYFQHGRRHSELLKEQQHDVPGGSSVSGPLAEREALILWLNCIDDVELNRRLDQRVAQMIDRGLVDELQEFHERYNKVRLAGGDSNFNYEHGIFQSIGFKEFHDYLTAPTTNDEQSDKTTAVKQKTWNFAVDQMKRRTRKYARTQLQWINNRMLQRPDRKLPCTYQLDVSDKLKWPTHVLPRAEQLVADYLLGHTPQNVPERVTQSLPAHDNVDKQNYFCEACQVTCCGKFQFDIHMKSKRHRYARKRYGKVQKSLAKAGVIPSVKTVSSRLNLPASAGD